jgi:hypothetical protein
MLANVTEQLWIDFGLDSAVFLDYIAFWIKGNARNKQPRNFHEGRYWTYNTLDALHTEFRGWSRDTIRGIIRKCVKNELLIVSNFNKKKYDRTCWYTLSDKAIQYYPKLLEIMQVMPDNPGGVSCGDFATPSGENPTPIPKQLPSSNNNTIITKPSSGKVKVEELMRELIQVYREEFPNNPQPHRTLISTSLEKVLRGLIKRWPEADPEKRPLDAQAFRRYMIALKEIAPKFALGTYETPHGKWKKNGLETFARWNTLVRFLEEQYS